MITMLLQCHFSNIFASYGLSEMTSTVTLNKLDDIDKINQSAFITNLGKPLPGIEIKRDQNNKILIKKVSLCFQGYIQNGVLKKSLNPDGFFRPMTQAN